MNVDRELQNRVDKLEDENKKLYVFLDKQNQLFSGKLDVLIRQNMLTKEKQEAIKKQLDEIKLQLKSKNHSLELENTELKLENTELKLQLAQLAQQSKSKFNDSFCR